MKTGRNFVKIFGKVLNFKGNIERTFLKNSVKLFF